MCTYLLNSFQMQQVFRTVLSFPVDAGKDVVRPHITEDYVFRNEESESFTAVSLLSGWLTNIPVT